MPWSFAAGDPLERRCWNGEIVHIAFALDCHDREALAFVAQPRVLQARDIQQLMQEATVYRFDGTKPIEPVQWLSDNGGIYTALETLIAAEKLGLTPITTPAYSPQSGCPLGGE
jgi:transposase InsO family protein